MAFIPLQEPLPPHILDAVLARGYYRMQQHVFTTNALRLEDGLEAEVLWARIGLENFEPNHRHRKLMRLNRRFACTLHTAAITDEIEDLYGQYCTQIDFDAGESVAATLLGPASVNFFPGRMWEVRDGQQLIGVGYFDQGAESAAGILNFYHPDYRKYSLGLWLYFESIRYAAERGMRFFYPGYIAIGYPKFDYKLLAGPERVEVWNISASAWIPYGLSAHAALAALNK